MRIIFMGTAELAVGPLEALWGSSEFEIITVVTQPDRPKGRDLKVQPSAVKAAALERNLKVVQPERARDPDFIKRLGDLAPELIVVVAYGQILPQAMLDLPRHGCLNVHTSLLPKYRGAAPIQWAILNGEAETGITIMKMDAGLDTGPILAQSTTPIGPDDTSETLHDTLSSLGAKLLVETLPLYIAGKIVPKPQDHAAATVARKIVKDDGHIDWTQSARSIHNRVRALVPWPGAFTRTNTDGGRVIKIWRTRTETSDTGKPGEILSANDQGVLVRCGDGALRVLELQREGGRRLPAPEFLRGSLLKVGEHL